MISTKDLYEELAVIEEVIEKTTDAYKKAQLKALSLQLKLLGNIRTNMVTVMKHQNIPIKNNETKK